MSFNERFDKQHPNFIGSLFEISSELTQREVLLCMYLKLNYSSKEISKKMGVSRSTLDIYRHRTRKKMNLERSDSLIRFLNNIKK